MAKVAICSVPDAALLVAESANNLGLLIFCLGFIGDSKSANKKAAGLDGLLFALSESPTKPKQLSSNLPAFTDALMANSQVFGVACQEQICPSSSKDSEKRGCTIWYHDADIKELLRIMAHQQRLQRTSLSALDT